VERLFEFDQKLLRFWLWIHFKQFLSSQQLDPCLQDPSSLNVCVSKCLWCGFWMILDISSIFLRSIGFAQWDEGDEALTFLDMWNFCRRHDVSPSQVVVNDQGIFPLQWLPRWSLWTLSEECRNMSGDCNVWSTIPECHEFLTHIHLAICGLPVAIMWEHMSNLIDQPLFQDVSRWEVNMLWRRRFRELQCNNICHFWCIGRGRWST